MRQETDKAERPGHRRSRLKALLFLVLTLGGVALLWAYHCVDAAPPEDGNLRMLVEVVPDGENGFVLLGQAAAALEWPDDVMLEEDEDDESFSLGDKLEDLVPEWIPAEPEDPFDGQPLRYDRSRGLLWSVGQDRKDVGGILEPDPEDPELDLDEPTLKPQFG